MKKKLRVFCSLLLVVQMILSLAVPAFATGEGESSGDASATEKYQQLTSPSVVYNMNIDWKFTKATEDTSKTFSLQTAAATVVDANGKQFYEVGYDDSAWETVSVPHPINGEDSFDGNAYDAGEAGLYRGFMFYRKSVVIPESDAGKNLILEFEAFRQSVYVYVNGEMVGYYEAGVSPVGFDITDYVKVGEENLIAVATDNMSGRGIDNSLAWAGGTRETIPGGTPGDQSGSTYQWNTKDFNEVQGGITGNVNLHAKGNVYQTLPLYNNLKTKGNYIYGSNYNIDNKSATINVEAEVRNVSGSDMDVTLQVDVVAMDGTLAYSFEEAGTVAAAEDADEHFMNMVPEDAYAEAPADLDISTVDVSYITASYDATDMRFWSDTDPYLYTVYTYLKDGDGNVIDHQKITTGFRKVEYDINNGGLRINDESVYLKGYAQRSTNEWAVVGVANDWLSDVDMMLLKESNGNHIRWMHIAPNPVDIRAGDKYGVISTVPAGDKESDIDGRCWDQRVEAMRDVMIYFRNNPSVVFWEAGNQAISAAHMKEMTDLRKELDPNGGRFAGTRTISAQEQVAEAEYVGTMLNRNATAAKASMTALDGKYMPITETEYARDEAPRRVWDDFSPPDYDYVNLWLGSGGDKKDGYDVWDQNSEEFAVNNAKAYEEFYAGRVGGGGSELYAGAAIMVWSDSNMHTRNTASENCRTSGKVDPVRIKKEAFYSLQAVQSDEPKIHIVGHWNYPQLTEETYWYNEKVWRDDLDPKRWEYTDVKAQRDPTKKTVYVIGSPDVKKVEIYINGELAGTDLKPDNTFVYAFPEIDVTQSGEISAKAYDDRDIVIAEDNIKTAGNAATIRLTPVTGPAGLIADGSDIVYFDVEVIDEEGNVCPLNYDRIDLKVEGEGVLLGGYNSGVGDKITTGKDYVYAECGVNRVFVKSTRTAGNVTLTASMDGLGQVSSTIQSVEFNNSVGDATGLSTQMQRSFNGKEKPPKIEIPVEPFKALASSVKADFSENGNTKIVKDVDETDYYTVTVNGTEVQFSQQAYRLKGANVISEVAPVLDALKAAGANIEYTYQKDGDGPSYAPSVPVISITSGLKGTIESGDAVTEAALINGYTEVFFNQGADKNLMDEVAKVNKSNELEAELKVILGYLDGVSTTLDEENKVYAITYGTEAAVLGLFAEEDAKASMVSENNKVTIAANEALDKAVLIFAVYGEGGTLAALDIADPITLAAGESTTIDIPAAILEVEGTQKAMLWNSLDEAMPICEAKNVGTLPEAEPTAAPVATAEPTATPVATPVATEKPDYSMYEVVQYSEDYSENTQTDGPDGTGYLQSTAADTSIYTGMGTVLASESRIEMDFRLDSEAGTLTVINGKKKYGPNFSYADGQFRTQTGSSSYQKLGALTIGEWYAMEIEGKMGVNGSSAIFRLYKWTNGNKVLVQETTGFNLRQFASANNGYADNFIVGADVSVDNVKVTSCYANEVSVTAMANEINANETVMITPLATRGGVAVTVPTFAWSLYNENGEALTDETITINESGVLITTAKTAAQTVIVRATAQTQGNPYGEVAVKINAIDTSNDKFDTITLSSDKEYVRLNENVTITPTVTLAGAPANIADEDIIWSVYNESNIREVKNIGIKVDKGVVSVNEDVLPQTITVRASNESGSAVASVKLAVKPANMILDGELGNLDTFVTANTCEELVSGVSLEEGSWDGTGYYKLTAAQDFTGFADNTSEHVLYSADMRFDAEGSGWVIKNVNEGKIGLQVIYTGGKLGIVEDSKTTPTYLSVDNTSWYNVQIMCSTGCAPNSYAHLILYKYDANGNKVHPESGEAGVAFVAEYVPMRNLSESQANHQEIQAGTSVDNVYCIKTTPDLIKATVDKAAMYAGQSVQGSVVASRKGVPFGYISSDLIKWVVYDENNEKPLDTELITIDNSGKMTVDPLADTQTVYMRAATIDGLLFDAVKVDISSSDIFNINTIGFNEDYSKVVELDVTKAFYYVDDVTFAVAVYDSTETTLKSFATKKMSGKDISMSEESVAITMDIELPEGFDKDSDVLYVYALTSINENVSITKAEDTISGAFDGDAISLTNKPTFDNSSKVFVLVLNPGTDVTNVKDTDVAYIKQFIGSEIAELNTITLTNPVEGDYIVEMAGKINGTSTLNTGVVTK